MKRWNLLIVLMAALVVGGCASSDSYRRNTDEKPVDMAQRQKQCANWQGCWADGLCSASSDSWRRGRRICIRASDADCAKSKLCRQKGACRFDQMRKECIVGPGPGCRNSDICKKSGYCVFKNGGCQGSDKSCRKSWACKNKGKCSAVESRQYNGFTRCGAKTDADCRQSALCKEEALCSAREGHCISTLKDCQESELCSYWGKCALRTFSGRCVPTAESCKKSKACAEQGYCYFNKPLEKCSQDKW